MSRYIDADALIKIKFHPLPYQYVVPSDVDKESYVRGWNDVIDGIIETMPTADVVEVVRCKDCTHCDCSIDGMGFFYCDFDEGRTVSPNGFCNVAERRKETKG